METTHEWCVEKASWEERQENQKSEIRLQRSVIRDRRSDVENRSSEIRWRRAGLGTGLSPIQPPLPGVPEKCLRSSS